MRATRREFLRTTGAAVAAVGAGVGMGEKKTGPGTASARSARGGAASQRRILFLGGTGYLGPHTVRAALARGHEVTLFNRGKTNTHLFPELEKLRGNRRTGDLDALKGREWDAVIDTSGYLPQNVTATAGLLKDAVALYVFISTISVYSGYPTPGMDESGPIGEIDDETAAGVTTLAEMKGGQYGPLKARCERAAEEQLPGRVTVLRPGLIVGPGDPTGRFTYWPVRVSRGGDVLGPGPGTDFVQFIDVRDLGAFIVECIERDTTGVSNTNGPEHLLTIQELLHGCKCVCGSDARFVWADPAFLAEHGVHPWKQMPVWFPPSEGDIGAGQISSARALAAGLVNRPPAETIKATLDWYDTLPAESGLRGFGGNGLEPDREREVIDAWESRG